MSTIVTYRIIDSLVFPNSQEDEHQITENTT